jgi:hypothetical protein
VFLKWGPEIVIVRVRQAHRQAIVNIVNSMLSKRRFCKEGETKDEIRIFASLFKGVSTRFGIRIVENSIEFSTFHLLFILPKSSFGRGKLNTFSFKSFQCLLESSLIVEYSRMQLPSLSSGCEIAQFYAPQTKMLPCWKSEPTFPNAFPREALFNDSWPKSSTHALEKCFPGKRIRKGWFGLPTWQHLRLGDVNFVFAIPLKRQLATVLDNHSGS